MALQGTIETFALPEVLRLLGSGAKTGRLRLSGDRGCEPTPDEDAHEVIVRCRDRKHIRSDSPTARRGDVGFGPGTVLSRPDGPVDPTTHRARDRR